ncbi:hypothetical protein PT974_03320 [Cladobotryum mycophilum]|uniref:DUF7728 domain-containing protein n=1 Tax=Cladobotryum mycophilum TaxID=491253 RepID=A0ABR0SRY9_9HYPO
MLLKPLALLTAAAAAASAFVIVPELSAKDESIFKALPIPIPTTPEPFSMPQDMLSQSLQLPCKQCWGRHTNLELDFAVEDGTKLVLNGFELYPNADPWHGDLMATVKGRFGSGREKKLGYSLSIVPQAFDEDQKMELVDVVLRVIEVGNRFVDQVPIVKVGLIKAATGEIIIGNVEIKEPAQVPCNSMFCRTKTMIGDALNGVKGFGSCGRGRHNKHRPHGSKTTEHPQHQVEEPQGHRHHESGEHHSRGRLLRNIIAHIVLPVLMGVTAGVGVAFLGMFICGVMYRLTTVLRSKCRRARARTAGCPRAKAVSHKFATAEEEKQGLMEADEAQETTLPPYKDDVEKK